MTPTPALTQAQYAALKHCIDHDSRIWLGQGVAGITGCEGLHLDGVIPIALKKMGALQNYGRSTVCGPYEYEPTDTARALVRAYEAANA